jgi:hypothetical protein
LGRRVLKYEAGNEEQEGFSGVVVQCPITTSSIPRCIADVLENGRQLVASIVLVECSQDVDADDRIDARMEGVEGTRI